ncbi:MAG: amidohydrolase family protein [Thermoguttaceae bacterium]|jgi:predicted TIM-barrel fold metal-dependent hydrolase|nr:amidohydrolase family protein [Thermoguttaceae bacterium]
MLFDTNAYLGPYAFRRLRHNTAAGLLARMDAKGIDKAAVSSAAAITYRNTQAANEELAEAVRPHRDRLVPLAVINPAYAGWKDDLAICHEEFGMKGLRLYPHWHRYGPADPCCLELVHLATERGMVVSIPLRVEDYRQRSWLVDVPDLRPADLVPLIKACPKTRFVLVNGAGFAGSPLGQAGKDLPGNYVIEISRLSAVLANEIGQLLARLGPDRVVFGTGMPFNAPDPALVKLEVLDATEEVKEQIRWKTAARLFASP